MTIDMSVQRGLMAKFEKDSLTADRVSVENEVENRTRHTRNELETALRHDLQQYSTLEYVTEDNPEIRGIPPEIRDSERRKRNLPVKMVDNALVYCQKNPRVTGADLKKLRDTKFKNWPVHLSIEVIPDLLRFGQTYMRLAKAQALLQGDPEPIPDDLMSPAPQPMEAATTADDPIPEETRID